MPAPIVFFDIAGPDLEMQKHFYEAVFGWDISADGHFTVPTAASLPGLLRVEAQAGFQPERVIYLGVDDIAATLQTITANGGGIVFPRMVVPGVVIWPCSPIQPATAWGLVELTDGKPIVPPAA